MAELARPRLSQHARLRADRRREEFFLLAPERGLKLSRSAYEVLALCDGSRSIADVVAELEARHEAAGREAIERDARELLLELWHRGLVLLHGAA